MENCICWAMATKTRFTTLQQTSGHLGRLFQKQPETCRASSTGEILSSFLVEVWPQPRFRLTTQSPRFSAEISLLLLLYYCLVQPLADKSLDFWIFKWKKTPAGSIQMTLINTTFFLQLLNLKSYKFNSNILANLSR